MNPCIRRGLTLAVCVIAGAALNVYRVSSWKTSGFYSPRAFQNPPEHVDGLRAHWARSFAKVEVFNQRWRPMRVTVTLRAAESVTGDDERVVRVSADQRLMGTFELKPSWSQHSFVVDDDAPFDGRLWLQFEREVVPDGPRGFAFAHVETSPILALRPILVHGASGALLGALTWFLLLPRRWRIPMTLAVPAQGPRPLALIALAGALFVLFCGWALIRPPFQTPDEPQHHLRATSILLHPWFAGPNRFDLDARYASPLATRQPRALDKLPFHSDARLTAAEIEALKDTPWNREWTLEPFERIYASYPTLFYLSVFAIAQPITEWLALSPYQSSFAYRFVTAAMAALLWTAVYAALRRTAATRTLAGWIVALAVLNPMVVFLSSGLNPDAVSFPLSTLAILAVWHVYQHGTCRGRALVCLLAAALVKPSAAALSIGLSSGLVLVGLIPLIPLPLIRRWHTTRAPLDAADADHPWAALLVVAQAGILSAWGFYLWSPLLFADQQGSHASVREYVMTRVHWSGSVAVELWGKLGWLDYQIDNGWYVMLYVLIAVNLACLIWRPRRPLAFATFTSAVFVTFAATTLAGEYGYLAQAGYTLQGRYFLPALLGFLAPVLSHRVPLARYALVAGLIVVHLLLAQRTVTRYYEDGWSGVRQALPFSSRALAATHGIQRT